MQKYKNNGNSNFNKITNLYKTHKNFFCKINSLLFKASVKQFIHSKTDNRNSSIFIKKDWKHNNSVMSCDCVV